MITITLTGDKQFNKKVMKFKQKIIPAITRGSSKIALKEVQRIWMREGPKDTGALVNSIRLRNLKVRSGTADIKLGDASTMRRKGQGAPVSYAKFWEDGFSTHRVLKQNIKLWTTRSKLQRYRQEGISNPYMKGNKRYVWFKGRPGLQSGPRAAEKSEPKIKLMASKEIKRLLK